MHIPPEAEIPREKLTHYLPLAAAEPALHDGTNEYGNFWRVEGLLTGPERGILVVTIWLEWHTDGRFRFVTLKPWRK